MQGLDQGQDQAERFGLAKTPQRCSTESRITGEHAMETFFGTGEQQAMLRRGRCTYEVVKDDPRLTYYGRTVGIADPAQANVDALESLVRLQGAAHYACVLLDQADALEADIAARGLSVTRYARWSGKDTALIAADAMIAQTPLPADVTAVIIDAASSDADLERLHDVASSCGVLLPAPSVLRGQTRDGLAVIGVDESGMAVCCAAAAYAYHPAHPTLGQQVWWGMLATRPARRSERLALVLGAMAMKAMHDRFGAADFFTGVQPGNGPSEAVCAKLGLTEEESTTLTVVDPKALASGKLTK